MKGESVEAEAISAEVWAKEVVNDLMKVTPEHRIWRGKNAFAVWFARRFMPIDFLDGNMRKLGALDQVKKAVA